VLLGNLRVAMLGEEIVQSHRQAILNRDPVADRHGNLAELDFDSGIVIAP
jgi:hypothetical protein